MDNIGVDVKPHEQHNRARWDQLSDWYQETHGAEISAAPDAWGGWRIPESELRLLPPLDGRDVLELGCGAGQWAWWLAGQGARVTGLDLSERQLAHAQRRAAESGTLLALVQASAESVPFATASFDLVLSDHGAMSWGDPDRTLPEVARVLRPGGLLIFCATSPWFSVCYDADRDQQDERLHRDYFGLGAEDEGNGALTFNLPYGEWVRRFRANHLAIEALIEPRPAPDATSSFWPTATAWARSWPAEVIWKVRRE
jgi:SAM-dependent methyltransferase